MAEARYPVLVVRRGREKAIRNRHHWVFSGAVHSLDECEDGSLVVVQSAQGDLLGHAFVNRRCSIIARMVNFSADPPLDSLRDSFLAAYKIRRRLLEPVTDAYRIVNAEADGMPGLVVDRYADRLVVQIATLGMERLKDFLVSLLQEACAPAGIYERSGSPARAEEGLGTQEGWLAGERAEDVVIRESGLLYRVVFENSQKTGFYLDQRSNRLRVRSFARGRRCLDCFSYTGGFAVAALKGGAAAATLVDSSETALAVAEDNLGLNGLEPAGTPSGGDGQTGDGPAVRFAASDAFHFLRTDPLQYDLVILDPPAFAKKRKDVPAAAKAYEGINRAVIEKVPPGSLLLTCSCSYHVDAAAFQKMLFRAAVKSGRKVSVLQRHAQSIDHPINIYHPETDYLKSFLLAIQ